MNANQAVLDESRMREFFGSFYEQGGTTALDVALIPSDLWPLMPYASFWGIGDDELRDGLVKNAPDFVKGNLAAVVSAFDSELDAWLAGVEASAPIPTKEYVAYTAMRMAADYAGVGVRA